MHNLLLACVMAGVPAEATASAGLRPRRNSSAGVSPRTYLVCRPQTARKELLGY